MFGAKLGRRGSPAHVAVWRIADSEPECIRLEVEWRVGLRANLVLRVRPASVVQATFVEHHRRASRFLWPLLVPVHHLIPALSARPSGETPMRTLWTNADRDGGTGNRTGQAPLIAILGCTAHS
ncbi:hypothetical protein [Saccharopolyspora erythraea]|uniref:DUF2867 domain-containing protein n=1 Tax=Saccharopolyspora erythraea TaxID=1836 RepID=A0ABN1DJY2_SACER|nr:hypothetical protein [Saccharopolyspora erythraea]QRK91570.1 hypothetical protein JQX30_09405 [Saccharopolyspora erythraea]